MAESRIGPGKQPLLRVRDALVNLLDHFPVLHPPVILLAQAVQGSGHLIAQFLGLRAQCLILIRDECSPPACLAGQPVGQRDGPLGHVRGPGQRGAGCRMVHGGETVCQALQHRAENLLPHLGRAGRIAYEQTEIVPFGDLERLLDGIAHVGRIEMDRIGVDHDAHEVVLVHPHACFVGQVEDVPVRVAKVRVVGSWALDLQQDVDFVFQILQELAVDIQSCLARAGQVNEHEVLDVNLGKRAVDANVAHRVIRPVLVGRVQRVRDDMDAVRSAGRSRACVPGRSAAPGNWETSPGRCAGAPEISAC